LIEAFGRRLRWLILWSVPEWLICFQVGDERSSILPRGQLVGPKRTLGSGYVFRDPEGNMTMKGYLKNPKATAEAFAGGWFHSGDLAVVEPDGYIQVKDRKKDIIISGGENISSIEVEDALYRHPAVFAAAVVAQPDSVWGESPCAFVELKPRTEASEAEIIEHCRANLAHYKAPKTVVFGPLPQTSTGKIQKYLLRQRSHSAEEIE
jgi:3-(methylthio)propionyl---CoA ligase